MDLYTPSPYQERIFKFIQEDTRNAVVNAVAGSGKTTTLLMAIDRIPEDKQILFMAYNKHIERELKQKADPHDNLEIRTVHSFGFEAICKYNSLSTTNFNKYRQLFRDIIEYYNTNNENNIAVYSFDRKHKTITKKIKNLITSVIITDFPEYTSEVIRLCELGRLYNIDVDIKQRGIKLLKDLAENHSINTNNKQDEVAWYLTQLGVYYTDKVDYADMIYLPNVLDLEVRTYDYVFIDEAQDISTCQRLIMEKAIRPDGGRFIAVGDPAQAIYGFAGADEKSFSALINEPNTITLPLSITYRCSKPIVDFVRTWNSQIEYHSDNLEGEILNEYSHKQIRDGDMILCRQTFPLVSLCIKYLSEGKKAFIIGSDIGLSLTKMVEKAKRSNMEYTMPNVMRVLYHNLQNDIQKIMDNHGMSREEANNDEYIVMTSERVMAIEALSKGISKPIDVIKKIKSIFSDNKSNGICLSTVHKSKGLENERVFILQPELLPSKRATLEWEKKQEENLQYVAYTRAKKTLGFIRDYDAFKGNEGKLNKIDDVGISKFIGKPNTKMKFEVKVVSKRTVKSPFNGGDSVIYDMVDKNGNLVTKFGTIDPKFLKNRREYFVDVNSELTFYAIIKAHKEYKGVKSTRISNMSKY